MNVKRGMQRLAVFARVLGAMAGGFASYLDMRDLLATRTRHGAFEALANSDVVRQERNRRFKKDSNTGVTFDEDTVRQLGPSQPYSDLPPGAVLVPDPVPASEFASAPSELDKNGIKSIHWNKDLGVDSIDMEDGPTIFPKPAPGFWAYFSAFTFPVLGFFIPWGLVNAVLWVGAGFVEKPT